jgi:hypothetical protein
MLTVTWSALSLLVPLSVRELSFVNAPVAGVEIETIGAASAGVGPASAHTAAAAMAVTIARTENRAPIRM